MGKIREDKTQLYRHFDAKGRLLYVGVSASLMKRLSQHGRKPWASDVATVKVEHFPTRREALHAEAKAIADESPLHNLDKPHADKFAPRVPDAPCKTCMGEAHRCIGTAPSRCEWWLRPENFGRPNPQLDSPETYYAKMADLELGRQYLAPKATAKDAQ